MGKQKAQKVVTIIKAKGQPDQVEVKRSPVDMKAVRAEMKATRITKGMMITPKIPRLR